MDDKRHLRVDHPLDEDAHLSVLCLDSVLLPGDGSSLGMQTQPNIDDGSLYGICVIQLHVKDGIEKASSGHLVKIV